MKYTALTFGLVAASTLASPVTTHPLRRAGSAPTDLNVLQYALTLENLEKCFYEGALAKFSDSDFAAAGYPGWVRGRISEISQHEASHVKLLSAALGNNTVAPCQYSFPYTDPTSFIGLAAFIENIGVSAYAGANQYITDPLYSTVAAVILSTEARHQGFLNGPIMNQNDWTGPYDTPLGLDMVYTLAAQLITSCPSSNAALPVTASTPLTSGGLPLVVAAAGDSVQFDYTKSSSSMAGPVMAVIYNGLGSKMLPYTNGMVTLPNDIQGYSYIILTNAGSVADVTTANTVAGPALVSTPFDASQSNPGFMNPYGA